MLQPIARLVGLLLQPIAVGPAEQVPQRDEAVLPSEHRGAATQRLENRERLMDQRTGRGSQEQDMDHRDRMWIT